MFLIAHTGCGHQLETASSSASGLITLDGKPLSMGSLDFFPSSGKGNSAFASIKPDGSFVVDTNAGTVGLEPGEYQVVVNYTLKEDENGNKPTTENPIPAKYRDRSKPALTVTVPEEGSQDLWLDLQSGD